jgi:hypothetical protein
VYLAHVVYVVVWDVLEKGEKRKEKKFGLIGVGGGETFRRHRVWRKLYDESSRGGATP